MDDIEKRTQDTLTPSQEDLETLFESSFDEVAQIKDKKKPPNTPYIGANSAPIFKDKNKKDFSESEVETFKADGGLERAKSSLRLKYEAEVETIRKTSGDLEKIRRQLGLSKRKVAQLLLVDPSAWTRWTSKDSDAPPHIYRALQWFMILQDKHPELKSSVWLNSVAQPQLTEHEIENIKKTVVDRAKSEMGESRGRMLLQVDDLKQDIKQQAKSSYNQLIKINRRFVALAVAQTIIITILGLTILF